MAILLILFGQQRPCFQLFWPERKVFLTGFFCSSGTASLGRRGKRVGKNPSIFPHHLQVTGSPWGQKKGTPFKGFLVITTIKIVTQATLRSKPGDRGKQNQKTHDYTHYASGFDFSQLSLLPVYGMLKSFGHLYIGRLGTF